MKKIGSKTLRKRDKRLCKEYWRLEREKALLMFRQHREEELVNSSLKEQR